MPSPDARTGKSVARPPKSHFVVLWTYQQIVVNTRVGISNAGPLILLDGSKRADPFDVTPLMDL